MHDLIIIGGGPGGVAAGIYAARKRIKTLLITDNFGGQSMVSADIQNWIGTKSVSGFELARMLEEHIRAQEGIDIEDGDLAVSVKKNERGFFEVLTKAGKNFEARYLLVASGSRRRTLNVPGEKEWEGKGVAYCSICDAPLFRGKGVAVIGGGNAGLEAVIDLLPYAEKIYLIARGETLKGDAITQERIRGNPKVEVILKGQTLEIVGEGTAVTKLKYLDGVTNEKNELMVGGVFVEVGITPNSDFVKDLVQLNGRGEIVVDPKTLATSLSGVWAVGDVSDVRYKQNNISVGDAVKATLDIYDKLMKT